ncbi:hypothetical protein B0T11DRAFT_322904 [Plectosphaerella cucumerina]|uniref:Uncharacterized protein n=1 Tax=Plectosphaerella cucumerina TaxID=40658 RepID=A0A8K0X7G6_9PEZI|nr:hypothetical protein B0T11DRAFT_322904 [Plectosphaerella cucumerina]
MEGFVDNYDWDAALANLDTPSNPTFDSFFCPSPQKPADQSTFDPLPLPLPPAQSSMQPPPLPAPTSQPPAPVSIPDPFEGLIDPRLTCGDDSLWGGESNTPSPPVQAQPLPLPLPVPQPPPGNDIQEQYAGHPSVPTLPPTLPPPPPSRAAAAAAAAASSSTHPPPPPPANTDTFYGFEVGPNFPFDPVLPPNLTFSDAPPLDKSVSAPTSRPPSTRYPTPEPRPATVAPPEPASPGPIDAVPTSSTFQLPTYSPDRTDLIPTKSKGKEVDYSKYYAKLPETPAPFLAGKFQYNRNGEWKGHLTFDAKEIADYIKGRRAQKLPLRVWVQNMPAGCNDRGGLDPRTRKCRWSDCPSKHNTILKGFWRVAFDERPESSGNLHDPYMNAGYFHLYCFERCFDLIGLIGSGLDVRPENRAFRREPKNPMAITRDCHGLLDTYNEWMVREYNLWSRWLKEDRARRERGERGRRRERQQGNYLWYRLTYRHLETESSARQVVRNQRGGVSIDKHFGDLDLYIRLTAKRVAASRSTRNSNNGETEEDKWCKPPSKGPSRPPRQPPPGRRGGGSKRRRRSDEDDLDEDEDEDEVDYDNDNRYEDSPRSGEPTRRSKRIAEIQSRDASPIYAHPPTKRQRVEAPILAEIDVKAPRRGNVLNKLITDADSGRLPSSHRASGSRASFP